MDVSHFGLFSLTSHQPRWTGDPAAVVRDRVIPLAPVRRGVANDNAKPPPARPPRPRAGRPERPARSLFRLVLHRTEPGQA